MSGFFLYRDTSPRSLKALSKPLKTKDNNSESLGIDKIPISDDKAI